MQITNNLVPAIKFAKEVIENGGSGNFEFLIKFNGYKTESDTHLENISLNNIKDLVDDMYRSLCSIQHVINNSSGVAGWHRNGEIASWDEFILNIEKVIQNYRNYIK